MKVYSSDIYFVKEEDTLSSISAKFNINETAHLIKNNITHKMLSEGMILKIK